MKHTFLKLLFIASVFTSASYAQQLTNNPVADAHVRDGTFSNSNYGATSPMEVQLSTTSGNTREAFLKFDLTGWKTNTVQTATLRINANLAASGSATLWAAAVSNTTWTSSGITWSNKPAVGTNIVSKTISTVSGTWFSMDVTAYIRSELAAGKTNVTLGLRKTATGTPLINIRSTESANTPQLVISPNQAPVVTLSSPFSGQIRGKGTEWSFDITGSDLDGSISRVDYHANSVLIGSISGTNFSMTWTGTVPNAYSIKAVAFDNLGLTATSAPINIVVDLAGLIGAWTFDDSANATFSKDMTGDGNSALIDYEHDTWVSHGAGEAISLQGRPQGPIMNATVTLDESLLPETGGSFAISLWFNALPLPVGWGGLMVSEFSTNRGWDLAFYKDAGGQVSINFWSSDNSGTLELSAPVTLTTNIWHKLDVTFDGGVANIYLDGRNVGTGYGGIQMSTNAIYVGGVPGMTNFNGVIDDLKIYIRDLAPHEIGPVANVQLVTVLKNASTNFVLDGVVPPGKALIFTNVTSPTNGTLSWSSPSNVTYTPSSNYKGPDAFQYTVSDGTFTSTPATVVISVVAPHWLSTNGTGDGSSPGSPMLAYPSNALDEIIRTNASYDCFFYAAGTYEMSSRLIGGNDGIPHGRKTVNDGCKHIGSGTNLTILKLVNAFHHNGDGTFFGPYSDGERRTDFEVSNMTLDCNAEGNPKYNGSAPITLSVVFTNFGMGNTTFYSVTNATIFWDSTPYTRNVTGHAADYTVYGRLMGGTYVVLTNCTGRMGGVESLPVAPTTVDEVRLVLSKRGNGIELYSVGELRIFSGGINIAPNFAGSSPTNSGAHAWNELLQEVHVGDVNTVTNLTSTNKIPVFGAFNIIDGRTNSASNGYTNHWLTVPRGSVNAINIRSANNMKLTNLRVVNFGTKDGGEGFPVAFGGGNPPTGNVLIENVVVCSSATNNGSSGGITALGFSEGYDDDGNAHKLTNAVVRNCIVADLLPHYSEYSHAFQGQRVENCIATNCQTGWYAEPGAAPMLPGVTLIQSNAFLNTPVGVFFRAHVNQAVDTVVVKQNTFLLPTNAESWGFTMSDDGYSHITNVVFLKNVVRFPNWELPSGPAFSSTGFWEWDYLNCVVGENLIHVPTNALVAYFDPPRYPTKRAVFNNVNNATNQVIVLNSNHVPASAQSQQWPQ